MRNKLFNITSASKTLKGVLERYIMSNVAKAGKRIGDSLKNKNIGKSFVNSKGEVEYRKNWLLNIMKLYGTQPLPNEKSLIVSRKNGVCFAEKNGDNSLDKASTKKAQYLEAKFDEKGRPLYTPNGKRIYWGSSVSIIVNLGSL